MEKNRTNSDRSVPSLQAVLNSLVQEEVGLKARSQPEGAPARAVFPRRQTGGRALPLDLAFLQTDPELTQLYKSCLAAQSQFDSLVQDFGVDDAMTAVAALQVDSLMKAYEERVRELRGQRESRGAGARQPTACNQNEQGEQSIASASRRTADVVDIRRGKRKAHNDEVLILWAAFAWWQSWETLRRALRRNDEDVGIRHLSPEFRCA